MSDFEKLYKKCCSCEEDIAAGVRRCPYCGCSQIAGNYDCQNNNDLAENSSIDMQDYDSPVPDTEKEFDSGVETQKNELTAAGPAIGGAAQYSAALKQMNYVQSDKRKSLGNHLKVFISVVCAVIPGLGQIVGIILAIFFMNSSENEDSRSFGKALMLEAITMFVLSGIFYYLLALILSKPVFY